MRLIFALSLFLISNVLISQNANITVHDYKESSLRYTITVEYPQIDYGKDALMGVRGIAQDINNCIDSLRFNRVNEFKNAVPDKPCTETKSSLKVTYKTVYNDNVLFSFAFDTFSAPDCAAHPNNFISTLNYSTLNTGAFSFADIFRKDKPYLKFISDYCIAELKARAVKDKLDNINDMIEQGASQKDENFRVFNITKDELIITFNPYQVGPSVWGIQIVSIPMGKIKDFIDSEGPLGALIK